jgi:hypothetical protein
MRALLLAAVAARYLRDGRGGFGQPTAFDWPLGPYHWPSIGVKFLPENVVNLCGGFVGHSKWGDVNPVCADYTIRVSRCVQVCLGSNSLGGFAGCLEKCGVGEPSFDYCEGSVEETYCREFVNRTQVCKCYDTATIQTGQQYHDCLHDCVYPCSSALQTEMLLGIKLPWRTAKCGAGVFFACGGDDGLQCTEVPAYECKGPVGIGTKECFADDPWCSDPKYVCAIPTNETIPLPAEVVREHPDAGWAGFFYPTHPPPPEPNITNASNATVFFWSAEPNATNASNATAALVNLLATHVSSARTFRKSPGRRPRPQQRV